MNIHTSNPVIFVGEVVEIIKDQSTVKVCVSYQPSILVFDRPKGQFQLGDKVLVSGDLLCTNIEHVENLDYINTNIKNE